MKNIEELCMRCISCRYWTMHDIGLCQWIERDIFAEWMNKCCCTASQWRNQGGPGDTPMIMWGSLPDVICTDTDVFEIILIHLIWLLHLVLLLWEKFHLVTNKEILFRLYYIVIIKLCKGLWKHCSLFRMNIKRVNSCI